MRKFNALLMREWLEHRNSFFWGPVVVLAIIVLAGLFVSSFGDRFTAEFSNSLPQAAAAEGLDVAGSTDEELSLKLRAFLNGIAEPFYWVLLVVTFFALIGCIHDERKDRSVLFWKSMPVSDWQCVVSKLVFIVWVAPLFTIAAIVLAQFYALVIGSLHVEDGMGSRVWSQSGLVLKPFMLLVGYFLQSLWALPLYAWILLVSSWAKRTPIMWVIGIPAGLSILERIFFESHYLSNAIARHLSLRGLPRGDGDFSVQLSVLADAGLWLGLLVSAVLLGATIYLRRRNNEI